jgi:hypothetical protein
MMSLRDLLTKQPSGVFPNAIKICLIPNPFGDCILEVEIDWDFDIRTSIDALLPDLQAGTPAADSFSGYQGGPRRCQF